MIDLGIYEYFKLKGDFYTGNLIEEKYKKLSHELHTDITSYSYISKRDPNTDLITQARMLLSN